MGMRWVPLKESWVISYTGPRSIECDYKQTKLCAAKLAKSANYAGSAFFEKKVKIMLA